VADGEGPWGAGAGPGGAIAIFVGLDIGTTSAKAVAYDGGGGVLAEEAGEYPLRSPLPDRAEQDPEEIFEAVLDSLAGVARSVDGRISGVGFGAAMHTLLALDGDGKPLTASITYADNRATGQARKIKEEWDGRAIHARTGTPVHPMSPLAKLLWFKEEDPETYGRAARWVSIKEYVLARLCGEFVVDHSIASATGLFSLENLDWDAEVLKKLELPSEKLSRPVPTTHVLEGLNEEYAGRLGLDAGTPFVVGANDGVLANLGVGATNPGVVACSVGTSGAVRAVVRQPRVDDERRLFCYALTEDRWVIGGPINNGGVAFQWARDALFPGLKEEAERQGRDPYDLMSELAEGVPAGSEGLVFLPYLMGERAPHWNAAVKGVFFGLTMRHRREHLIRAVLEGVMFQLYQVARTLKAVVGEPAEVRATGGFVRSELWRRIMADIFGREIVFPESREGSCWGAALLAMNALGELESLDAADAMTRIADRQKPNAENAAAYRGLAEIFARLYDRLEPEFEALTELQRSLRKGTESA